MVDAEDTKREDGSERLVYYNKCYVISIHRFIILLDKVKRKLFGRDWELIELCKVPN